MTKAETIRLDKWLWFARFFKTRSLASKLVAAGHVRVNGTRAGKPAQAIGAGDFLTFAQGDAIRVVQVVACGTRRGPAPEAQTLYTDQSPRPHSPPQNSGFNPGGRPSKKDRRQIERFNQTARLGPLE